MAYLHGVYGEIMDSQVSGATQADSVYAYIGTAPVNLIRGYADLNLVNMPVKIANMSDAQSKVGYSGDWASFTLCEAFAQHFDNTIGNVGPIYVVNVLDPDVHKDAEKTDKTLTFKNNRTEFESSDIILDTFAIADKVEGVDYSLSYNFASGNVIVQLLKDIESESLECTYNTSDPPELATVEITGTAHADGQDNRLRTQSVLQPLPKRALADLA